jgi:anti-anti-sigma regulatory factor
MQQPLVIQASDPDVDPAELAYMRENKTATSAIFPLVVKGQAIGVMELETRQERHYTPEQINIAMMLANQVAVALENARLYDVTQQELAERKRAEQALEKAYAEVEKLVEERTAELKRETAERERAQAESLHLQQEVIEAQQRAIRELSTPVIPVMETPRGGIIIMPLIGRIDSMRARDITRALLAGIREQRAKVVILDITGVPLVDSGVASHLNKTIQAARLKGARTIITGISDAVAETIVDMGIDWSGVDTLSNLRTGLVIALNSLGIKLTR